MRRGGQLGDVRIRALHTPGHRPEHCAFALVDTARGDEPWAVLTGDSLFVNDIARPDLAVDKEEGAHGIFHSLHDKLLALPAFYLILLRLGLLTEGVDLMRGHRGFVSAIHSSQDIQDTVAAFDAVIEQMEADTGAATEVPPYSA